MVFGATLSIVWLLAAAPPPTHVQGPLDSARRAEVNANPKLAIEIYRRLMSSNTLSPTEAAQAEARFRWLTERGEDDYRPLTALFQAEANDREKPAVEPLLEFEKTIDGFPPGHVRGDARAFVAQTLVRHRDPADALPAYRMLMAEPGLEPAERLDAARGAALVASELGNLPLAIRYLTDAGLGNEPQARQLRAERLASFGVPVSWAILGLFGVFAFVSLVIVAGRRRFGRVLSLRRGLISVAVVAVPLLLGVMTSGDARDRDWQIAGALAAVLLAANIGMAALDALGASRRWVVASAAGACAASCAVGFVIASHTGLLESLMLLHRV